MIMKISSMLTAAMVCLGLSIPAAATVTDLGRFTADIPNGWNTKVADGSVTIMSPDSKSGLVMTFAPDEGKSGETLAGEFSSQCGGEAPAATEDGGYTFAYKYGDKKMDATGILYVEGNEAMFMTILGNHPNLEKILDSMEDKSPKHVNSFSF
ncbi:hypothetical protein C4J81_05370 [Deltaproteobacteria bacterium Smac51]|nr:hypothetical protein C4J81_05370 [Deltaproteobacteria bacterium Smac51]